MRDCPKCHELNDADATNCASCKTRLIPFSVVDAPCARHVYKHPDGTRADRCVNCGGRRVREYTAEQLKRQQARSKANRAERARRKAAGELERELLYVDGHRMAFYVRRFAIEFENAHGKERAGDDRHEARCHQVLSDRCGEAGGDVSSKMIREIGAGRKRWLLFYETADPLLVALGLQHLEQNEFAPVTKAETAAVSTGSKATVSDQRRVAA